MPGVNHQAEQQRPALESKQKAWIFSGDLHAEVRRNKQERVFKEYDFRVALENSKNVRQILED